MHDKLADVFPSKAIKTSKFLEKLFSVIELKDDLKPQSRRKVETSVFQST